MIKFEITQTQDYCGGAMPPEEVLEEYRTPKPFAGTLYIHQNAGRTDDGIALKFENGSATTEGLVRGTYTVFLEKKMDIEAMTNDESIARQGIDIGCLQAQNLMPIFSFEVEAKTKKITNKVHLKCNPCLPPAP